LSERILEGKYIEAKRSLEQYLEAARSQYGKALGRMLLARASFEAENQELSPRSMAMAEQGLILALERLGDWTDEERLELAQAALDCARWVMSLPWDKRREALRFLDAAGMLTREEDEMLRGEVVFRKGLCHYQFSPFDEKAFSSAQACWEDMILMYPGHPRFAEACLFLSEVMGIQGDREGEIRYLQFCLSPAAIASPETREVAQNRLSHRVRPQPSLSAPSHVEPGQSISFRVEGTGVAVLSLFRFNPRTLFDLLPMPGQLWSGFDEHQSLQRVAETEFHLNPLAPISKMVSEQNPGFYAASLRCPGHGVIQTCLLVTQTLMAGWRFQDRAVLWCVDSRACQPLVGTEIFMRSEEENLSQKVGVTDESGLMKISLEPSTRVVFFASPQTGPVILDLAPFQPALRQDGYVHMIPQVVGPGETAEVLLVGSPGMSMSPDVPLQLTNVDRRPIAFLSLEPLAPSFWRGELRLPWWSPPGTYGFRKESPGDPLFPWMGYMQVSPVSRPSTRIQLTHESGWVEKGETARVSGRLLAGIRDEIPLSHQGFHFRVFREKREIFCDDRVPFSVFWAGGDLEVEGEGSSGPRGEFTVEFDTRAHGKEEIYRLDLWVPWNIQGSMEIHAMKPPFPSKAGRYRPSETERVSFSHSNRFRLDRFGVEHGSSRRELCKGEPWELFVAADNPTGSPTAALCVVRCGNDLGCVKMVPPGGALLDGPKVEEGPILADLVFVNGASLGRNALYIPLLTSPAVPLESMDGEPHWAVLERRAHRRGFVDFMGSMDRKWMNPKTLQPSAWETIGSSGSLSASVNQGSPWVHERQHKESFGVTGRWLSRHRAGQAAMEEEISRAGLIPTGLKMWERPPVPVTEKGQRCTRTRLMVHLGHIRVSGSRTVLSLEPTWETPQENCTLWIAPSLSQLCAAPLLPYAESLVREERILFSLFLGLDERDAMEGLVFLQNVDGGWRWPDSEKSDPLLTSLLLLTEALQENTSHTQWVVQRARAYLKESVGQTRFQGFRDGLELVLDHRKRAVLDEKRPLETINPREVLSMEAWGPFADPLRKLCSPTGQGTVWDMERYVECALDPYSDPLIRALWCLVIRTLERDEGPGNRMHAPPRVNGLQLHWKPTGWKDVVAASWNLDSGQKELFLESAEGESYWILATCPWCSGWHDAMTLEGKFKPVDVHFRVNGSILDDVEAGCSLPRGCLVEKVIEMDLSTKYDRLLIHDTFPAGWIPLGDFWINESLSNATFGSKGLFAMMEGLDPGPLKISYRLIAEDIGRFIHEGTWITAWGPCALKAYGSPGIMEIH